MKKTTLIASGLAVSLAALIGGSALAQITAPQNQHRGGERMARVDTDGDGKISQSEFVQARVAPLTAMDANHDGSVSGDEMRTAMSARRAERASARFDRLDADRNGQISRAEFDAARSQAGDRHGRGSHGERGGHEGGRMGHGRMDRSGAERVARGPVAIADVQTRMTQAFARLDTDHDGFLSQDERRAGARQMGERMRSHGAERMNRRMAPNGSSPSAPTSE